MRLQTKYTLKSNGHELLHSFHCVIQTSVFQTQSRLISCGLLLPWQLQFQLDSNMLNDSAVQKTWATFDFFIFFQENGK